MMMNNTLAQLRDLKLAGMAYAVEEQLSSAASTGLSFEERLALMVDREVHHRGDKRRAALMKKAGLKYPQACIEDVDSKPGRGLERSSLMSLALSRWVEDLRVLHGNGGFGRQLAAVARTDVLLLDDWGLAAMDGPTRADLMEVIDDRAGTRPTLVTSQLPVEHWHAWIGDATVADAIVDRLLSSSHRLNLKGKSMRPGKAAAANIEGSDTATPQDTSVA